MKKPPTREHRIAYAIALVLFLWFLAALFLDPESLKDILGPLDKVLERLPFVLQVHFAWMFIIPVGWFLAWYYIIKFCLRASRHFQVTIAAVVIVGFIFHAPKSGVDWTSGGLNPNAPGFKPQVVILAGTTERGFFEIRMRGADYYYCEEWNDPEWENGSWYRLYLAIPDFAQSWGLSRGRFGTRGGGGSWLGRSEDLVLARRLWNGTNFIGATTNDTVAEERQPQVREEFEDLEKVGPFLIPKRINFESFSGGSKTYNIKKIEFWNRQSTNWFLDVKRKHFDRDSSLQTIDLNEPGPIHGKR
jgi:hypothetical protein